MNIKQKNTEILSSINIQRNIHIEKSCYWKNINKVDENDSKIERKIDKSK